MPSMGVDNLRTNLTNPARVYLWEVVIPNVIGGGADSATLLVRAQSSAIPGRSHAAITVPYKQTGGLVFPGKVAYSHTWVCTFIESEDKKVHDFIYNWMQLIVHDRDGVGQGDPSIQTDILLSLAGTKGDEYMRIKMIGAYVQDVGDVALTYTDEAMITYSVTFAYNRWERVK